MLCCQIIIGSLDLKKKKKKREQTCGCQGGGEKKWDGLGV